MMQNFLVRYRVNNKSIEEEIVAASEKEALEMTKLQAGWDFPKKEIRIISIKGLKKIKD
tara:strand:+ start:1040 stop:1216 length:177 start_codon:yes stop_codon:yes gene_type:complete